MHKLDKTEILVTIGDTTYVREVKKTSITVCVYISSFIQSAYSFSLIELLSFIVAINLESG